MKKEILIVTLSILSIQPINAVGRESYLYKMWNAMEQESFETKEPIQEEQQQNQEEITKKPPVVTQPKEINSYKETNSSRETKSYQTTINNAISKYAYGQDKELAICMKHKMTIFVRRAQQKDSVGFAQDSFKIIDAAAKATVRTCRAESDAYDTKPSFDCTNPSNQTETTICNTPELRQIDVQFDNAVIAAKSLTPYRQKINDNLKEWIKSRNQCLSDVECIRESYKSGMEYIENL